MRWLREGGDRGRLQRLAREVVVVVEWRERADQADVRGESECVRTKGNRRRGRSSVWRVDDGGNQAGDGAWRLKASVARVGRLVRERESEWLFFFFF